MVDKKVFVLVKNVEGSSVFAGVFTNKKLLFEVITKLGCENCFIQGVTKRIPLSYNSLSGNLKKNLKIFSGGGNSYFISTISLNEINPKFNKKE